MRTILGLLAAGLIFTMPALADDHGNTPLAATPITVGGGLTSACLETGGDMDYFFFQTTAGRTYSILTSHLDASTDTVVYLLDADGLTILRVDDNSGTNGGSRIEWAAPFGGTYFVMVRHAQATSGTGCYSLSVSTIQVDDHGNSSLTATPILVGSSASGFLESSEDTDAFFFDASGGYIYDITLDKTSGEGAVRLDLFRGESMEVLLTAQANGGAARLSWIPETTGSQFLAISPEDGSGGFRLSVEQAGYADDFGSSAAEAEDLAILGFVAAGRIEVAEDADWFQFSARANGEYSFSIEVDGPVRMALVGLDGETVLEDTSAATGSGIDLDWAAPSDGVYFLEITGLTGGTAYTLRLEATLRLEPLGQFNPRGYSFDVAASGDHAYLIVGAQGLPVVDVSDPFDPIEVGSHSTRGYAQAITLHEDQAFVANRSDGLTILDISDPMRPSEIGNLDTPGSAWDVFVSGGRAYVADSQGGLQIIGVGRSGDTSLLGSYETTAFAKSVVVRGSTAFVALGDAGIELVDVSTPESPTQHAVLKTFGEAHALAVTDSTIYVASGYGGVRIVDVSDLTVPVEIGSIATSGEAIGLALVGSTLYVAEATDGLSVYSVVDPLEPQRIAQIDTPGEATNVSVDSGRAYIADREEGLQIVELLQ